MDEIVCTCDLSIVGADSLVTVNNIKRARYCLQVAACVSYSKLKQAHMDSGSDELIPSWLASKSKISEMSFCWKLILELMINLLAFIRSLREGKYPLSTIHYLHQWWMVILRLILRYRFKPILAIFSKIKSKSNHFWWTWDFFYL